MAAYPEGHGHLTPAGADDRAAHKNPAAWQRAGEQWWLRREKGDIDASSGFRPPINALSHRLISDVERCIGDPALDGLLAFAAAKNRSKGMSGQIGTGAGPKLLVSVHILHVLRMFNAQQLARSKMVDLQAPPATIRKQLANNASACEKLAVQLRSLPQPCISAEPLARQRLESVAGPVLDPGWPREALLPLSGVLALAAEYYRDMAVHMTPARRNRRPGLSFEKAQKAVLENLLASELSVVLKARFGSPRHADVATIIGLLGGGDPDVDFVKKAYKMELKRRTTGTK